MKRIVLLVCALISFQLSAQYSIKNKFQTTLGVGISNYGAPVSLSFDYGLFRDISLGLDFSNRYSNETYKKYRIVGGNLNLNYHLNHLFDIQDERWDVYAGAYYNYWLVAENIKNVKTDSANMGYGLQLGMRFFQWEHIGFHTELSGGTLDGKHYLRNESKILAAFKLGLTYRF